MKNSIFLIGCLCLHTFAFAQQNRPQFPCDSLLGKPYEFLYDAASAIMEAEIVEVINTSYMAEYNLKSLHNYKNGWSSASFYQYEHPQWYTFEPGQIFVFLIFQDFVDPAFSPCILFGHKAKMGGLISYAHSKCIGPPIPSDCSFQLKREHPPICGCDGITYKDYCIARSYGITTFDAGPCEGEK